jgi:hypothetical protein
MLNAPELRLPKPSRSEADFTRTFATWFEAAEIEQVARQTGWMKRQGKIVPLDFVIGACLGQMSALELTLAAQAEVFTQPTSRQALDQRYRKQTVEFFHTLFDRCLAKALLDSPPPSLTKALAAQFAAVHLVDSTSFDCPASLAQLFPGCGGDASVANCKVLMDYEYTRGEFRPLALVPGNRPDGGLAPLLPDVVKPGELIITDKGFWRHHSQQQIDHNQAFFLTPWQRSSHLWVPGTAQPGRLPVRLAVADRLRHTQETMVEWPQVWIGDPKAGLTVRVVAFRLSEESANRHRAALRRDMQKKGRQPTAESLELAGWLILLTNAPAHKLPTHALAYLYRIRWQIELVFKQCKSVLRIHQTLAQTNIHRMQSEIWARLMAGLILFAWHAHLQAAAALQGDQEISFGQVARRLQQEGYNLARHLIQGGQALLDELRRLWRHLLKTTRKACQRTRQTSWQLLNEHWLSSPACN